MKKIILYLIFLLPSLVFAESVSIHGKVVDAQTGETLPGAVINIPDLKLSVVADADGKFYFSDIPSRGRFLFEIKYLGYSTLLRSVDLSLTEDLIFQLRPSTIEAKEV